MLGCTIHGSTSIYNFTSSIASTDLCPDLVVWSSTKRVVIPVELTVSFETNFIDPSQWKTNKYQDLVETCRSNGFSTALITLEVGSGGFLNLSSFQECFSL